MSKSIDEGRPTTTNPTFVALPSLTSHSTFYECLRGILCKPQDSPHSPLTRLGVIISYSLRLERKITVPSIQKSFCPTFTLSQVTKQYDTYTASPAKKTTSAIIEVKIDKSLQFSSQSVEYCPRYNDQSATQKFIPKFEFFIPSATLTLIYLYKPFYNFNMRTPTNIPETPMGETEQDSFFVSKEKFQQQLQDIFQTILKLTGPDRFDQLCQWMEYNQYRTIDDFYDSSYNDPEKFYTKGPATEYTWKGKMNHLSPIVAQKLKCFVRWMTHEDRPYELHDDFLATLTRERYLKFRHMDTLSFSTSSPSHHEPSKLKTSFSGESKHQTPSESQTALNNYKKGSQRKAFFSQQEEISDDDEYANAEEQFSTDPEPEEHSPYSVYQSSLHPKMPQKSFLPPNIWETPSESTKQMIIEHNKKVKLNNPTPYPSGSKTKPNPTLGKPTPAPQQVHQHSQDEPTEEPTPDTSTQTLVNKCLAESGIDPTDIQNVMPVSYAKRNISPHESSRQIQPHQRYVFARVNQSKHHNCDDLDPTDTPSAVPTALQAPSDDTYNPKCTHSLMETQCNHSQYPILMKQNCTHNPSTSQVSKSYHPNPVIFPSPPDPGEILTDDTNTIIIRSAVRSATKTSPNLRLDPPKGEDQPQDLTSDVFVYGRPNPDGSDNTPPMSIINFDDLLGRTFLLPMDENGERKRATISEHVKDLCQQQVSREDQLRFKLKIDGDPLDDLISYNQLMEYLADKTDTGPLEDGLSDSNASKIIKDHILPDTIPTRNGRELGEIWVRKVGTNF